MHLPVRLLPVVVLAALAACSTVRINQDFDPAEDFARLHTYSWYPEQPQPTGNVRLDNPLLQRRIQSAVDRTLAAKGYRKVEDRQPDFYVNFSLSTQSKLDVRTIDSGYYGGPYGARWGGAGWGGPGWTETYVDQYQEGTLVLDVIDVRARKLVWRGFATGRLREQPPTPEEATKRVDQVVADVLAQFPPR